MYSQTDEKWKKIKAIQITNINIKKRGDITKESYDIERIIKQYYK